ncbi:hypothetical protein R6Q57_006911 [Mikania cordata]
MREKQAAGDGNRGGGGDGRSDSEKVREMLAASASVFPGFRFSPTDDELISFYLKKKLQGCDNCVDIIPEVDICRHEPWELPGLSIIQSDNEWFFFSARGKKYPNGSQSKRATKSGYWKATGKERNVKSGTDTIGTKRTLVFHTGRAPKGERTEWIMHEYCMCDTLQEALVVCRLRKNDGFRLNESSRGSSDHRISSAADSYHQSASNTQMIVGDEFEVKSGSLDSKSSFRSDSESVSDLQLIADLPSGYSTPFKEGDIEDDCFADIINDDIIKLDESGSHSLMLHGVLSGTKYTEMLPPETLSNQGTAVRRFRRPKGHNNSTKHENPSSKNNHNQTSSDKKVPGCVFSILGGNANTLSRFHPLYLVFLFLLILLVAWRVDRIEVATRQLWYWLRKGADCL